MEHLAVITAIVIAHLLAVMSPGPDFIMAVRNTLTYSRRTGMWTSVGFAAGILVHIIYSLAGLAVIISQSILVFTVIKMMGAAYLVYIGIMSWRSRGGSLDVHTEKKQDISAFQAIKMGFFTNVLNPKATLFFLSLFTLIITPETPLFVLIIASTIMMINQILWFCCVAFFFSTPKVRGVFQRFQDVFNKVFGAILVALGIKVALSSR